ncbi:hypothetical protein ACLKOZ_20200 [Arthrobacter sp. R4]|uniref:hypothetical protein n=1 Tax=Arthrobacter sp. R4 TaxID=644417 RepID=UPI003EDB153E
MTSKESSNSAKPGKTAKLSEGSRGSYIVVAAPGPRPANPPRISAPAAGKKK